MTGLRRIGGIDFLVASRFRVNDPLSCLDDLRRHLPADGLRRALVRTWWIIPDDCGSYDRFAAARRERLHGLGFCADGPYPASTCIRRGRTGRAAVMAVAPSAGAVRIERVSSEGIAPEPISYGYTYDRAVVVHGPRSRVLFVSATAGMTADGAPVDGGLDPQFDRALGIVGELVERADVERRQVSRMVIWCDAGTPAAKSATLVERCRGAFPNAACVAMRGGIVRDGFVTEIEAIAEGE